MLALEEAQGAILERIRRATETESVSLRLASGRYLAEPLHARVDNPAFDNSAMDGYAVNTADLQGQVAELPVLGESSCGSAPGVLAPGTAMRIFTGAPLPQGADAVVMQEAVDRAGGHARFSRPVVPGDNVRRRGEDFCSGEVLYGAGRRLTPFDIALLSTAGIAGVPVYRRARVLVVATGNELVSPGTPLKPGQIYESNRLATLLQMEALGAAVADGGMVPDQPNAVRAMLRDAADYDFVITSGGVSVGDHDLVKQIFAETGRIEFWRVKIKPGKPLAFGRIGERGHFFGLPGNPVASLVTFKLFVEPALIAWHHGARHWPELRAMASNAFKHRPGRTEFVRARLRVVDGGLVAVALQGQGSHQLGTLRETNALIRVEADSAGFACGDTVTVTPLSLEDLETA